MSTKTERQPAGVSLDPEVYRKTKILAEENHRNFSNYVNLILLRNIEKVEKEQGIIGGKNKLRKAG